MNRVEPDGAQLVQVSLRYGRRFADRPKEVFFRSPVGPLSDSADYLLPVSLLPAMLRGEHLEIDGRISPHLRANLPRLQHIYEVFGPDFAQQPKPVEVHAEPIEGPKALEGRGVACFFSGGTDSFYSALTHKDEIDALIFIHGLDIRLEDDRPRDIASAGVRSAAAELGLPLIEVETTVRTFSDRFVHWELYCGSPLAAIALLFQPLFRKVYVPGSFMLGRLFAYGSHPLLDPLWSTESTEIIHDPDNAERLQKLEYISSSEVAQKYLRVCFEYSDVTYNCGHCLKCITTMIQLMAVGKLDQFKTFPRTPGLGEIEHLDIRESKHRERIEDGIAVLEKRRDNPRLLQALYKCMTNWALNIGRPEASTELGSFLARGWPKSG